jgi:DNA-directed RNA polymerase specialized sigma24 family protein
MSSDDEEQGSVTRWIGDLKGGDQAAAQALWERYFDRLVRLARKRLVLARASGADEDEEDAALSAFDTLCRGIAAGRFPNLEDRADLWRLLATITARKAADQARREGRQKRGGGRVLGEADLDAPGRSGEAGGLGQVAGDVPTPSFALMMDEEVRRLFDLLPDETLRLVALLKMEGYTNEEIARRLDCAQRSVERKLERIRLVWGERGRA